MQLKTLTVEADVTLLASLLNYNLALIADRNWLLFGFTIKTLYDYSSWIAGIIRWIDCDLKNKCLWF